MAARHDGFRSRKLWLIIFTEVMLVGSAVLAASRPALAGLYPTLAGSLVACAGLYGFVNVAAAHVAGKQQ